MKVVHELSVSCPSVAGFSTGCLRHTNFLEEMPLAHECNTDKNVI